MAVSRAVVGIRADRSSSVHVGCAVRDKALLQPLGVLFEDIDLII